MFLWFQRQNDKAPAVLCPAQPSVQGRGDGCQSAERRCGAGVGQPAGRRAFETGVCKGEHIFQ